MPRLQDHGRVSTAALAPETKRISHITALQLFLRLTAGLLLAAALVACEGGDGADGAPGTDATADTVRLRNWDA